MTGLSNGNINQNGGTIAGGALSVVLGGGTASLLNGTDVDTLSATTSGGGSLLLSDSDDLTITATSVIPGTFDVAANDLLTDSASSITGSTISLTGGGGVDVGGDLTGGVVNLNATGAGTNISQSGGVINSHQPEPDDFGNRQRNPDECQRCRNVDNDRRRESQLQRCQRLTIGSVTG